MTCYKYVVTAQKPTATHFTVKGPFTASTDVNLILGKGTRIEIYTLTPDGLKPTLEFSIYGTIRALDLYKPRGRDKASLFVLTSRRMFCILSYSERTQQIITEANGEIGPTGPPHLWSNRMFGLLDPTSRYFAIGLHERMISVLTHDAFTQIQAREGYSTRRSSLKTRETRRKSSTHYQRPEPSNQINLGLGEKKLVSMVFLHDAKEPTLAVLYDDPDRERFLQTFVLHTRSGEFFPDQLLISQLRADENDNLLIAVPSPIGGVLLIGETTIRYLKKDHNPKAVGIRNCSINCYTMINREGTRFLLGDRTMGHLYLLTLKVIDDGVDEINFIRLGQTSAPICLAYLDNDVVFVGSHVGDSQLVHINSSQTNSADDILEVMEEFPNLAPIPDFCVVDLDKQGQAQLVTCSGAGQDSSLRIIRNGVGLNELAAIDITGVKGIWSLRPAFDSSHDDMIVFSFINQTSILQLRDYEMSQIHPYASFDISRRTLAAGNVVGNFIIQVTDQSVRLMETGVHGNLLDEWIPKDGAQITVASLNPTQCVLSTGHGRLFVLEVQDHRIMETGDTQLNDEISCIDITPLDTSSPQKTSVVAIGVWQQVGVRLLSLPTMQVVAEEILAGTAMPRSILMAKFEDISYLLVALGDGQFYNFKLDTREGRLWDKKRSFLGKMPIALGTFSSNDTTHVFAASDKPSVIHSRNQKLIYSNVNLKDVRCVTSFNSSSFPDAVALTTKDGLVIGQMEEIQKLHITKIGTRDTQSRIVYQESSKTFGVITSRLIARKYESPNATTSAFEVHDDQTFKLIDRIYVKNHERIMSVVNAVFDNDGDEYYVLATGYTNDPYERDAIGRLVVYRITADRKLEFVSQLKVDGIADNLRLFQGKLLASVSQKIQLFRWELEVSGRGHLALVCSCPIPSICESIATHGNMIVIGDMARAVVAMRYNPQKQTIEAVAHDKQPKEITAVEALGDDLYLAAEESGHLFVYKHTTTKVEEEGGGGERAIPGANGSANTTNMDQVEDRLDIVGQWHFGERIHSFRFGSLATNPPDPDTRPVAPSLIFCTANGSIGVLADLSGERFKLLLQMQSNLVKVVPSIGHLSHTDWRNIDVRDIRDKAVNFIDGDLIESFLDLTPQEMQNVVDGRNGGRRLESSVEDLCKVVEELMSVHS